MLFCYHLHESALMVRSGQNFLFLSFFFFSLLVLFFFFYTERETLGEGKKSHGGKAAVFGSSASSSYSLNCDLSLCEFCPQSACHRSRRSLVPVPSAFSHTWFSGAIQIAELIKLRLAGPAFASIALWSSQPKWRKDWLESWAANRPGKVIFILYLVLHQSQHIKPADLTTSVKHFDFLIAYLHVLDLSKCSFYFTTLSGVDFPC